MLGLQALLICCCALFSSEASPQKRAHVLQQKACNSEVEDGGCIQTSLLQTSYMLAPQFWADQEPTVLTKNPQFDISSSEAPTEAATDAAIGAPASDPEAAPAPPPAPAAESSATQTAVNSSVAAVIGNVTVTETAGDDVPPDPLMSPCKESTPAPSPPYASQEATTTPALMQPLKNLTAEEEAALQESRKKAALDCEVSDWSEWAVCASNAGSGLAGKVHIRERTIFNPPKDGGKLCPDLTQTAGCSDSAASTDVTVTDAEVAPLAEEPAVA